MVWSCILKNNNKCLLINLKKFTFLWVFLHRILANNYCVATQSNWVKNNLKMLKKYFIPFDDCIASMSMGATGRQIGNFVS